MTVCELVDGLSELADKVRDTDELVYIIFLAHGGKVNGYPEADDLPVTDFDYKARRVGTWQVPLVVLIDREDVGEEDVALVERLLKRIPSRSAILLSRAGPRRKESVTFFETIWHLPAAYFLYALRA